MSAPGGKYPKFTIRKLTNADADFYPLVGPLLSRRNIVKELGSPVWDDDGKVWHVAVNEDDVAIGIVGRHNNEIVSMWVQPDSRGQLVGAGLLNAAANETDERLRAVVTPAAVEMFELYGFKATGSKGSYTKMERATR